MSTRINKKEFQKLLEYYDSNELFDKRKHEYEWGTSIYFTHRYMSGNAYTGYDDLYEEEASFYINYGKDGRKLYHYSYHKHCWEGY